MAGVCDELSDHIAGVIGAVATEAAYDAAALITL